MKLSPILRASFVILAALALTAGGVFAKEGAMTSSGAEATTPGTATPVPAEATTVKSSKTETQGNPDTARSAESEWKYIPVRRLAQKLEESLYRETKWVVFEPNDEPLWAQVRLKVGDYMMSLYRQGVFQGSTPKDAFFVKCDKSTTTQDDINLGIVNILVGFAPLKPAEFEIIKIRQHTLAKK